MITQDISYSHDGTEMLGRFYAPDDEVTRPGILVVHGAHGLNGFIETVSERLAMQDFAVLAVDMWGGRKQLSAPQEIGAQLGAFAADRATWMGRLDAARKALIAQKGVDAKRLGALGYCFGGSSVLEMARNGHPLKGVVSFHGGLDQLGEDWSKAKSKPVLLCSGAADPLIPSDQVTRINAAMEAHGVAWEHTLFGGAKHAFTEPDAPGRPPFAAFDATADHRSWLAMSEFFADLFN